jgi:hypothetical protein
MTKIVTQHKLPMLIFRWLLMLDIVGNNTCCYKSFYSRDTVYFRFTVRHLEFQKSADITKCRLHHRGSGMVENVGKVVGSSLICQSSLEIWSTSGLQSAILNCTSWPTSGYVGRVTIDSGMVKNAGAAVGISVIRHSIPELQCTSGLQSAILNFACRPTSSNDD